jgi:hypothetical protein
MMQTQSRQIPAIFVVERFRAMVMKNKLMEALRNYQMNIKGIYAVQIAQEKLHKN